MFIVCRILLALASQQDIMRRIRFEVNDQAKFDLSIITKLWPYLLEFRQRIGIAVSFLVGAKIANVTLPFVLKNIVDLSLIHI